MQHQLDILDILKNHLTKKIQIAGVTAEDLSCLSNSKTELDTLMINQREVILDKIK
jgi:hypothetical protein